MCNKQLGKQCKIFSQLPWFVSLSFYVLDLSWSLCSWVAEKDCPHVRGFLVSVPNQQAVMTALAAEGASDAAGSTSPLPLLANLTLDEFLEGRASGSQQFLRIPFVSSFPTTSPSLELIFFLGNLKLIWGKPITYGPAWSVGKSSARGQGIKLLGRTGPLAHWVVLGKSPPLYGP